MCHSYAVGACPQNPIQLEFLQANSENPFVIIDLQPYGVVWLKFIKDNFTYFGTNGSDGNVVMTAYYGSPGGLTAFGPGGQDDINVPAGTTYISVESFLNENTSFTLWAF
jgi:hypothetical protein